MTQKDIVKRVASWIQAARESGKTYVQLKWQDPELQFHEYPETVHVDSTIALCHKRIEIPDFSIPDKGLRVTSVIPCDDKRSSLQLATALLTELFD